MGRRSATRAALELPKAQVAVRDEGTHSKLYGERQRGAQVNFRVPVHGWPEPDRKLSEQAQRLGLVASLSR